LVSKHFLKGTSSTQIPICNSAKYKGRVKKLSREQTLQLKQDFISKKYSSKAALGKAYGLSRQSVYKYINEIKE